MNDSLVLRIDIKYGISTWINQDISSINLKERFKIYITQTKIFSNTRSFTNINLQLSYINF